MAAEYSRRLSSRLERKEQPATPRIYYYRNRYLNRSANGAATASLYPSESEPETVNNNESQNDGAGQPGELDARRCASPERAPAPPSKPPGEASSSSPARTSQSPVPQASSSPIGLGSTTPLSFASDLRDPTSSPDSPFVPRLPASSPIFLPSGDLSHGEEPLGQHNDFETQDQELSEAEGSDDEEQSEDYELAGDSPVLSKLMLALSIFASFLTYVDVWLVSRMRSHPIPLFSCFIFFFLMLAFTLMPTGPQRIDPAFAFANSNNAAPSLEALDLYLQLSSGGPTLQQDISLKLAEHDQVLKHLLELKLANQLKSLQEWEGASKIQLAEAHRQLEALSQQLSSLSAFSAKLEGRVLEFETSQAHQLGQLSLRADAMQQLLGSNPILTAEEVLQAQEGTILAWIDAKSSAAELTEKQRHEALASELASVEGRISSQVQALQSRFEALPQEQTATFDQALISKLEEIVTRVSIDIVGKPDYALAAAGAQVLSGLTSQSYGDRQHRWGVVGHLIALLSGGPIESRSSPEMALSPELTPGNCWAFAGSQGNLTIRLAASTSPRFV